MYQYINKDALAKDIKRDHNRSFNKSTGIPVHMKHYIENKTGLSYDDLRIHYHSDQPDNCEEQYKREAPIQMLLNKAAQGSKTMGKKGLSESSFKYHTIGYYELEGYEGDAVWSNHEHWMEKGEGDHAEDAICDHIENLVEDPVRKGIDLKGRKLCIYLSSSPCKRCQERLNKIRELYGLEIQVICAKIYGGEKCGGPGDDCSRQYAQEIVEGNKVNEIIQL